MCLFHATLEVSSIWRCLTCGGDVRRALKQAQLHLGNQFSCVSRFRLTQRAAVRTRKTSNTSTQAVYLLRKLLSHRFVTWKLKLKDFGETFFLKKIWLLWGAAELSTRLSSSGFLDARTPHFLTQLHTGSDWINLRYSKMLNNSNFRNFSAQHENFRKRSGSILV